MDRHRPGRWIRHRHEHQAQVVARHRFDRLFDLLPPIRRCCRRARESMSVAAKARSSDRWGFPAIAPKASSAVHARNAPNDMGEDEQPIRKAKVSLPDRN